MDDFSAVYIVQLMAFECDGTIKLSLGNIIVVAQL